MKNIIIIILLFSLDSSAQELLSIIATVEDTHGAPLEFASVSLEHFHTKTLIGTITDQEGKFDLQVAARGNYTVTVSFIGYNNYTNEINLSASMNLGVITLDPDTNTMDEIVVSGKRVIIEKRRDKLVFNVDQSLMNKGYDGMEVLERSPNVMINSDGGILMRNQRARVMINGKLSNLVGEELANYVKTIRSENIKSIEIQTHQSSSIDAETTGGIINIILKKKPIGIDGIVRTEILLQGDGQYRSTSGLNLNYGAQKWNLYGSYNFMHHLDQGFETFGIDYFKTQEKYNNESVWDYVRQRQNYQLGFVFDPVPKHTFGFEFSGSNSETQVDYIGDLEIENLDSLILKGKVILDDVVGTDLQNATFNYTWAIDSDKSVKIYFDYLTQKYYLNNDATSIYEFGNNADNLERNYSKANTDIYVGQIDFQRFVLDDVKLETGLKYTQIGRNNTLDATYFSGGSWIDNVDRTTSFSFTEEISAGFLTLSKKFKKLYFLKAGLRIENTGLFSLDNISNSEIEQNYTNHFPSLFLSRDLKDGNMVSFSYVKSLSRPSFRWLNNNVIKINDFRYQLGNPNLRPEYHDDFELSLKLKKQSITAYYRQAAEAINGTYILEDAVSYYQFNNAGKQQEVGVEYNYFGNVQAWWYLKFSTNLNYKQFVENSSTIHFKAIAGSARFTNNFKLGETTNIDLTGIYYTRYNDGLYYSQLPYYRVDVTMQKTLLSNKLNLSLNLDDIFDTAIYIEERPTPIFRTDFTYKGKTRRVRLAMSYNFSTQNEINKRKNASKNDAKNRM